MLYRMHRKFFIENETMVSYIEWDEGFLYRMRGMFFYVEWDEGSLYRMRRRFFI